MHRTWEQQSMGRDREGRGKANAQLPTPGLGSNGGIVHETGTLEEQV